MKELTSSIPDFEKLIKEGYLYVDKTEYIWKLIKKPFESYFMIRPWHFGKTLTISTLEAVFQGKRDLFKGLAIYDKPYDWKEYPIIRLDMGKGDYSTMDLYEKSLCNIVQESAGKNGLVLKHSSSHDMFSELFYLIDKQRKVVVLIDDYDKPFLDSLGKPHALEVQKSIRSFYSIVKAENAKERFVLVTGTTSFFLADSLAGGLNNLLDVSMYSTYATMYGYTQDEIESYYGPQIDNAAREMNMPREEFIDKLKEWYGGFLFEEDCDPVYNPKSISQFFDSPKFEFRRFWNPKGIPVCLFEKYKSYSLMSKKTISEETTIMCPSEVQCIETTSLLLQMGFLTIDCSRPIRHFGMSIYPVKIPNIEAKQAFEEKMSEVKPVDVSQ